MLPRTMSQGHDASKDAESVAKADASQNEATVASSEQPLPTSLPLDPSSTESTTDNASSANGSASEGESEAGAPEPSASAEGPSPKAETAERKKTVDVEGKAPAAGAARRARASREDDEDDDFVIPETEEALNIPKKQTIGMLGAMSTLTLVAWFAARLACNAHPDQVREPKHFSTKDLAADPKNAAFEFHHSFETYDFTTALDLSMGEVKKLVTAKLVECESAPDACEDKQKALAGSVNSVGRVFEQSAERATVELVSHYSKALEPKTFQFVVEKQGDYWRVSQRREVASAVQAKPSALTAPTTVSVPGTTGNEAAAPPVTPPVEDAPAAPVTPAPATPAQAN